MKVSALSRMLAVLAALLLAAAGLLSVADGISHRLARDGEALARAVSESGDLPAQEPLAGAVTGTQSALAWQPWSPDLAAQLGALKVTLAIRAASTETGAQHAGDAASAYQSALRGRPSSGYFWSGLAAAELLAQRSPVAVERALQRAMVFGGWDPAVQPRAMWLGMTAWPMLGESARAELRTLVRRALERDEGTVFDLALGAGWTAELRALLTDAAQRRRLDRRLAAKRTGTGGS